MYKPILCLDFDGVIHSYTSGWKGPRIIPDPPVPGALQFLQEALLHFDIHILSSRSHQWGGRRAMKKWLIQSFVNEAEPYDDCPEWLRDEVAAKAFADSWEEDARQFGTEIVKAIHWPIFKPPAFLTIDDRAMTFNGVFTDPRELKQFKPWYK